MEKNEILSKAQENHPIGEMEQKKINTCCWIALIFAGIVAIIMMITLGALGHLSSIWAIAAICFCWASLFYFLQYFVAKRRYTGILIGALLEGIGAIIAFVLFALFETGILG